MGSLAMEEWRLALPIPQTLLAQIVESNSPAKVGAPEMMPVSGSTCNPEGRSCAPNKVGAPEAVMMLDKGASSIPLRSTGPVIIGTAGAMESRRIWLSEAQGLTAVMIGKNGPLEVGVPEMRPLVGLRLRPSGRYCAPKETGLCMPWIW